MMKKGDDTTKTVIRGWGQILPHYVYDVAEVVGHATVGRSVKSFRGEGRQFSHDDTSANPERYASPESIKKNLIHFMEETRAKEVNPMLFTPLVMRTFHEGDLINNHLKTYQGIIQGVAREYNSCKGSLLGGLKERSILTNSPACNFVLLQVGTIKIQMFVQSSICFY